MDVQLSFQKKKTLQKRGPGRHTTPNVTQFRTGPIAEVVALSSSGDCGAPPSSGCLVGGATQLVTCTCGATCPRGFLSSHVEIGIRLNYSGKTVIFRKILTKDIVRHWNLEAGTLLA